MNRVAFYIWSVINRRKHTMTERVVMRTINEETVGRGMTRSYRTYKLLTSMNMLCRSTKSYEPIWNPSLGSGIQHQRYIADVCSTGDNTVTSTEWANAEIDRQAIKLVKHIVKDESDDANLTLRTIAQLVNIIGYKYEPKLN